jgi:outer membrane protein OmpU
MKNFLYGTTALATAGLIAGVAGNAAAADRIAIGVHGYHQQFLVGANQDYNNDALTGAERSTNLVDEKHNSEICFVGQTTLDNGITFGVNVQLEGNTEGDQIDESYLFVRSDSLGQLIMGDENNAGYLLHVTAPNGGISLDSGDVTSDGFFVNPGQPWFNTAINTTNLRFQDNDSGKATYISPRFAGIQLGVSFIPQFEGGGDNNSSLKLNSGNSANINNGWAGGINYTEDFNGFGVQLSGGYLWGDNGADSVTGNDDNLNAYNVGAQFSYAGFSFGGAYVRGDGGLGTISRANSRGWTVGAAYEVGPYTVGITYQKGEANPTGNSGKAHLDQGIISGSYQLGPGIRLVGGVFAFDGESETNGDGGPENEGYGGTVGFKLGF